jgi:hypothetical protein
MVSTGLIALSLLLLTSQFPTEGQELQCHVPGDCTGMMLFISQEDSYNDCLDLCKSNVETCTWITHNSTNMDCIQFLDCPSIDPTCTTCYSGEVGCRQEGVICDEAGFCQGNFIMADTKNSSADCLKFCQSQEECQWYSYFLDTLDCTLTSDCPIIDDTCSNCVHGQKECEEDVTDGKYHI